MWRVPVQDCPTFSKATRGHNLTYLYSPSKHEFVLLSGYEISSLEITSSVTYDLEQRWRNYRWDIKVGKMRFLYFLLYCYKIVLQSALLQLVLLYLILLHSTLFEASVKESGSKRIPFSHLEKCTFTSVWFFSIDGQHDEDFQLWVPGAWWRSADQLKNGREYVW